MMKLRFGSPEAQCAPAGHHQRRQPRAGLLPAIASLMLSMWLSPGAQTRPVAAKGENPAAAKTTPAVSTPVIDLMIARFRANPDWMPEAAVLNFTMERNRKNPAFTALAEDLTRAGDRAAAQYAEVYPFIRIDSLGVTDGSVETATRWVVVVPKGDSGATVAVHYAPGEGRHSRSFTFKAAPRAAERDSLRLELCRFFDFLVRMPATDGITVYEEKAVPCTYDPGRG